MKKTINIKHTIASSFFLTIALVFAFVVVEPSLSMAIEDQFTISQTITAEIAFSTAAADVTMNGSIAGITGGTALGSTTSRVTTNNNTGFTMTIVASSSPAMQGETQGGTISDYTPATAGIPDFAFSVPSGAEFGFTVVASTTGDMAQKFKDNGSVCNAGSSDTGQSATCWMGLSTTATSTMVTTEETTASGATSTIVFKTLLNSSGAVPEDTYKATTTLTAVIN